METFRGEPFVDAATGAVTPGGFAAYYTAASLFVPHDMHFSNLLFDVWGLHDVRSTMGGEHMLRCLRSPRLTC